MNTRFSGLVLLFIVSGFFETVFSEKFENLDELTIAQPLDLSVWFQDDYSMETALFGTWQIESGDRISIFPMPMASNACLIQISNRMVPGFLFEIGGNHYVVVGDNASESLKLSPRIFKYSLMNQASDLEVSNVFSENQYQEIENPDTLVKMVLALSGESRTCASIYKYHRI